jgi:hypothetical protein
VLKRGAQGSAFGGTFWSIVQPSQRKKVKRFFRLLQKLKGYVGSRHIEVQMRDIGARHKENEDTEDRKVMEKGEENNKEGEKWSA